ncbi:Ca2+-binding RTX toxin-like protein [Thermocatellispora tengchongensis]|uniref:Ca2+-binding RTX toxin-like protein n=1 Tax=Thermocatellispora tengchongensis TaxID=1073253 RepID=A0A840P8Q6_9ACTN|nr:hypothetical protein [Thermocatellispora tengchongensis]MBB5133820.1 Ca2+-binding RTX toxin-like protein [Thermocatellispora tengchongensis]
MSRARHALTALVLSAAALTTATALAAPAYAVGGATVSVQSGIMIVQGTAESDTIEINPVSGGVSVSAPASQRVTPSTGCFTVTPSKVTCTGVSSIQVNLFGGDDNGNNNTSLPTIMAGSLGGDTLSGGDGRDDLRGGRGNDVLDGSGGIDVIDGGLDIDTCTGESEVNCER